MPNEITMDRDDLDNAVFGAAQEAADTVPGLTVRQKMKWSLETADKIMAAVDSITEAGKRSAAGRKAAEARHSKPKPTPGPAIPPPAPAAAVGQSVPPVPGNFLQAPDVAVPPPPHPSLDPAAVPGATPAPFGALPA